MNDNDDDDDTKDEQTRTSTIHALSHSNVLGEALRKRYREDDDDY